MTATLNTPSQTQKVKKAKVGIELRLMRLMQSYEFQPAEMPIPDGQLHRIDDLRDKPCSKNLWYVLHKNGSGCFSHWSRGCCPLNFNFKVDYVFTPKEIKQMAKVQVKILTAEASDTKKRNKHYKERLREIFENLEDPSPDFNYLAREGIKAYSIMQFGPVLAIPMYRNCEMVGLQYIQPNGKKCFALGSEKVGAYFRIRGVGSTIYVTESYSTAATIYERTGSSVFVAFDSGNLEAVARMVDAACPNCDLLIWIDKNYLIQGNPGLTKAIAAAKVTGAKLAGPAFPPSSQGSGSNDKVASCSKGGAK